MSDIKKDEMELSIKNSDDNFRSNLSSFLKSDHHTFVVQKAEKLASAVYVVTGFIPQDDPLRTRLRTCVVDLISSSTDPERARDIHYHEGFTSRCLEIGTILQLAEQAGFVSPMNAKIICEEYANLASFVRTHHDKIFERGGVEVATKKDFRFIEELSKTKSKGPGDVQGANYGSIKKTNTNKRHSNRRNLILAIFDIKDRITINDAVASVNGCSEKTIQRELMSLVQDGLLIKEGERRWSTYRKASSV